MSLGIAFFPNLARATQVFSLNQTPGSSKFGTIDLSTGVFTDIGSFAGPQLAGLGVSGGMVYGGEFSSGLNTLDVINTTTGLPSAVGNGSIAYYGNGDTPTGLFGLVLSMGTLELFSVNPSTAASTFIGSTGLSPGANTYALSSNCGSLYLSDGGTLYSLNTSTGAATTVGNFVNTSRIGAMVCVGGTLYGGDNQNVTIDTINTTSALATLGPSVSGTTLPFWGLAPEVSSVPEPRPLFLLAGGFAALAIAAVRRART